MTIPKNLKGKYRKIYRLAKEHRRPSVCAKSKCGMLRFRTVNSRGECRYALYLISTRQTVQPSCFQKDSLYKTMIAMQAYDKRVGIKIVAVDE